MCLSGFVFFFAFLVPLCLEAPTALPLPSSDLAELDDVETSGIRKLAFAFHEMRATEHSHEDNSAHRAALRVTHLPLTAKWPTHSSELTI